MTHLYSLLLTFTLLLAARPAAAAETYFTREQLLASFFPGSEKVTFRRLKPTPVQQAALKATLGAAPRRAEWVIFVAMTGEKIDGYAVIDDEPGQHEPITFGVKLSPAGVVERQEIMVYRETYGAEVADPRFEAQFVGKSAKDPLRLGVEVDVVTGATISCRSMAIGVRRVIAVVDELVVRGGS